MSETLMKEFIGEVGITIVKKSEILKYITTSLQETKRKLFITTPNPEIIMHALKHPDFKKVLNASDLALPDGVGVVMASKILGGSIHERITGVNFMEELCKESVRKGFITGFLGGRNKVAEKAAECLIHKYPGLKVGFLGEEWDEQQFKVQSAKFKVKQIDILFVAFGFPKQEEWIAENLDKIPVKCAMGVGGSFDYLSGQVPRAPEVVQQAGLEWLFRLIVQPWRWKRQFVLLQFVGLILKEYGRKS